MKIAFTFRRWVGLLVICCLFVVSASALLFSSPVQAAGETFTQTNANTITMSGAGNGVFTKAGIQIGTDVQYGGRVTVGSCHFAATITLQAGSTSGTLSANPNQSEAGAQPTALCSPTIISSYNGNPVAVAGGTTTETDSQKTASVDVNSPLSPAQSPATVTVIVKNSAGATVGTKAVTKKSDGTYTRANFLLTPGKYTFSVTGISGVPARTITKVKFVPLLIGLGDLASDQQIIVNVTGTYGSDACEDATFGPIDLTATGNGNNLTGATNATTSPANPNCGSGGGVTGSTTFKLTGTINGAEAVPAGSSYQVCAASSCVTVTKKPGQVAVANITLSASDAAAAAGSPQDGEENDGRDGCPIGKEVRTRWIMCPMFRAVNGFVGALDGFINEYMSTGNLIFDESQPGYHKAWETFRNFALGLVVIAGLVMLISEAIGLSIVDAYTVRKVLPRLLVAIIGITVSWELCHLIIGFFDDLGHAMGSIVYSSFDIGDEGISVVSVIASQLLVAGAAAPAAYLLTGMGVVSLFGTLALAMLVAAVVLILRQVIIVAIVLMSPLAIAAYILPNTSKISSFAWTTLKSMLILYPVATGLIALCKVLGKITMNNPGDGPAVIGSVIATVTGMVLFFAGYALIPVAFRLSGGAVAQLAGLANDKSRGAFDGLSNFRKGRMDRQKKKVGDRMVQSRANKVQDFQDKANDADRSAAGRRYYRGRAWVTGGMSSGANVQAQQSAIQAETGKEINDIIKTGIDSEVRALSATDETKIENGQRMYKTLGGAWVNEAQVLRARQRWGKNRFAQQASLSYEMRKASTEEEAQGIAANYASMAKAKWGMSDAEAGNAWMGAAYDNQGQHLEFKRTDWKSGTMSEKGRQQFVDEIYENKGSYPLSQVNSNTIEQLSQIHDSNAAKLASGSLGAEERSKIENQQQKLASVSQTFMREMGSGGNGMVPGSDGNVEALLPGQESSGRRQFGASGATHTNERARQFAAKTGVLNAAPTGNYDPAAHTTVNSPNTRRQSN